MTEDEYTDSLARLTVEETRRALALDAAVKSMSPGHTPSTILRQADRFAEYIKAGRWS